MLSRRRVLSSLPLLALGGAGCGRAGPGPHTAPPRRVLAVRGADLSFTLQQEAVGGVFRDRGRTAPVEELLAARGATTVRLRLWVDPPSGYSDLESALTLAARARDVGLDLLLDLHYSDFWADQANQTVPATWAGQDLPTLARTVRAYTRDVVRAFDERGLTPAMVQVGNEITSGMLWPVGRVYTGGEEHWEGFLTLLRSGLRGVSDGAGSAVRTVVHIDRGGDNGGARYFYDQVTGADIGFDVIALSYYPFWHGPLAALAANLDDLATRYDKDVLVVETSYPWRMPPAGSDVHYFAAHSDQLPEAARFPATPAGQAAYFEHLRAVIQQVPGGRGLGFLDWEPAWLPGVGWDHGEDNPYGNLTMFDWSGEGLPSLTAFRAP